MNIVSALCAILLLLVPGLGSAQARPEKIAPTVPEIDRIFADFHRDSGAPGLVYGIVADGRLVHVKAMGVQDLAAKRPVTPHTLFRIASMSKAFTALAILKLRDEGKLSLDALAETYIPEMRRWRYPTADSPRIRVRDLLNHLGGFVSDDPWGDRQQVITEAEFTQMLKDGVPFTRAPGTAYEYSNFGYALLGRIVTNVSGASFDRYIGHAIQRPLGMNATGYEPTDWPIERRAVGYRLEYGAWSEEPTMRHGAFGSMGGVQTSADDYAKWMAYLLAAWPPRDDPEAGPVRRSTVRELTHGSNFISTRPRPGKSGAAACPQAMAYGMGMRIISDCEFGLALFHGGGFPGYGSHMLLLPDYGVGIFVFANKTYNGGADPVWDAAVALRSAGALTRLEIPVSSALAGGYTTAGSIYKSGTLAPAQGRLAMNFLMDRTAENWGRELTRLKKEVGDCDTNAPVRPTGALSGTFEWVCDRGRLGGNLLLAPTNPPTVQSLTFHVAVR